MGETFGLVDCNNFYVSCERVFAPSLEAKPVVVLSNNDGNVIARSQEAKDLGVSMGMPFFQAKPIIEKHNGTWFSSNYALYGDMSRRVMETVDGFVTAVEHYSIDEAFVSFDKKNSEADAHDLRRTVRRWTGIPVSIGIGPTKVLAKIANTLAKRNPDYGGVVDLTKENADRYLKDFDVSDVWGIGRRYAEFLKSADEPNQPQMDLWEAAGLKRLREKPRIETAFDLKNADDRWIRKHLTVKGLRLVWELRGVSCLPLELFEQPKKGICCSQSFGVGVKKIEDLRQSVTMHAARAGEKLRRQHLAGSHVTVFVSTSRFRQNPNEMYSSAASCRPLAPSSFAPDLIKAACQLLEEIYKPGFEYRKTGVLLTDIVPDKGKQASFLLNVNDGKQQSVMRAVDQINHRFGRNSIRPLAMGFNHDWRMKQERLSNRYTTRIDEIASVKI
jgi:DNA polymerase V